MKNIFTHLGEEKVAVDNINLGKEKAVLKQKDEQSVVDTQRKLLGCDLSAASNHQSIAYGCRLIGYWSVSCNSNHSINDICCT